MRHYGLIGRKLGHSWSATYFARKFADEQIEADYRLIEISALGAENLPNELDGYNVTIPYKRTIIPYLREVDPIAEEIGAVNVVKGGKGYNTDWTGFVKSLCEKLGTTEGTIKRHFDKALILGQGGAARAVLYGLKTLGIEGEMISVRGKVAQELSPYGLIVNATPLGMTPDCDCFPDIRYDEIGEKHVLYDCVYNPKETIFLKRGKERGAIVINGVGMLHIQAEESWKIWNNQDI